MTEIPAPYRNRFDLVAAECIEASDERRIYVYAPITAKDPQAVAWFGIALGCLNGREK